MRSPLCFLLVACCSTGWLFPSVAFGAAFSFSPNHRELPVGSVFEVGLFLDAQGDRINAVEGRLNYLSDRLHLVEVRDGDSAVPLWITHPHGDVLDEVAFSGVIPGGEERSEVLLFRLAFRVLAEGSSTLVVDGPRVLLDDGFGTSAAVSVDGFDINGLPALVYKAPPVPADTAPPEPFQVEVGRDPAFAGGQRFVVFLTHDKGRGMSHYEIKEVRWPFLQWFTPWTRVVSPAVLGDQARESWVLVRAVDVAGNVRVSQMPPVLHIPWYSDPVFWVMMLGASSACLLVYFLARRRTVSR